MPENNQYPDNQHGTFTPVGIVLIVAIIAVVAIFVYGRASQDAGIVPTQQNAAPANPAAPVVPGTNVPANPPGQPSR